MIDTSDPFFIASVFDSFTHINELKMHFDSAMLKKQKFFDTVDEYMDYVHELEQSEEDSDGLRILYASIAIRIMRILSTSSTREKKEAFLKCRDLMVKVRSFTTGHLPAYIRKFMFYYGCPESHQAPRGWSCAICVSSTDSHLCEKTACGHYFHHKCLLRLDSSDNCPLCRQKM